MGLGTLNSAWDSVCNWALWFLLPICQEERLVYSSLFQYFIRVQNKRVRVGIWFWTSNMNQDIEALYFGFCSELFFSQPYFPVIWWALFIWCLQFFFWICDFSSILSIIVLIEALITFCLNDYCSFSIGLPLFKFLTISV